MPIVAPRLFFSAFFESEVKKKKAPAVSTQIFAIKHLLENAWRHLQSPDSSRYLEVD